MRGWREGYCDERSHFQAIRRRDGGDPLRRADDGRTCRAPARARDRRARAGGRQCAARCRRRRRARDQPVPGRHRPAVREEHRRGGRAGGQGQGRAPRVGRPDPRADRRSMMPSVLVVEDEPAILELLRINLLDAGYEVRGAADAETARRLLNEALPDLVLLDWMLPGQSGLALARELRADKRTRELPIIMVTAKGDEADKVAGLEAWVDDYVTKPFSPRELKARIKAVMRRRAPELAQEPLAAGALTLDPVTHRAAVGGHPLPLGPTEFRLLRFLLARPERVHSRAQLLDQVWGDQTYIEERTVDVHIRRLRAALEPFGHANLIETVRGSGYRLAAPR